MADVKQEPATLNSVSFLWDPTRDTGVFVKVHCISTEFTPKKHGGERGVPFRLQVYSSMPQIYGTSQIFKLRLRLGATTTRDCMQLLASSKCSS